MCAGIAIVGIVPESGPIQFFGRDGNSSHDTLLSECVPIELHNRSFKIEYIFPGQIRLDAPDAECRKQAVELGIAEIQFGIAILRPEIFAKICDWLRENPMKHDKTTMQQAYLSRADLSEANLSEANLSGANLSEAILSWADLSWADLSGANLSWADLSWADLSGANLSWADLSGANLFGANLFGAYLSEAILSRADLSWADLSGAILSDEQKEIAKKKGAVGVV